MAWSWHRTVDGTTDALQREVTLAIEQVSGQPAGTMRATVLPHHYLGADLGLSSIAVARLAVILQRHRDGKALPFHRLFMKPDGAVLQDVRVADLVAFLEQRLRADEL